MLILRLICVKLPLQIQELVKNSTSLTLVVRRRKNISPMHTTAHPDFQQSSQYSVN
jgi:hypothetical protein